ncbi:MAG: hypothetical protein JWR10_919 [Rubritepida sp.]|nr:hypothetical protein [Rubritepida sp.]
MAQPPRKVIHSTPNPKGEGWITQSEGRTLKKHDTQKESEADAIARGHGAEETGGKGQAVLHKKDGTIREERTYGDDPKKSKG